MFAQRLESKLNSPAWRRRMVGDQRGTRASRSVARLRVRVKACKDFFGLRKLIRAAEATLGTTEKQATQTKISFGRNLTMMFGVHSNHTDHAMERLLCQ